MNVQTQVKIANIDWTACEHWSSELPYRSIVAVSVHPTNGGLLYQVAGSSEVGRNALNALRLAVQVHGGQCFYCTTKIPKGSPPVEWNVDHIEPSSRKGSDHLCNLVVACKVCNTKKADVKIDDFNPAAGRRWLRALNAQIKARLARLPT